MGGLRNNTHPSILTAAVLGNHTYPFNALPLGVEEAVNACTTAGGVLPTGETEEERTFIQHTFQSMMDYGFMQSGLNSTTRWLVNFNDTAYGGNNTYAVYEACEGYNSFDLPHKDCGAAFTLQPLYPVPASPNCTVREKVISSHTVLKTGDGPDAPPNEPTNLPVDEPTDLPVDEPTDSPPDEPTYGNVSNCQPWPAVAGCARDTSYFAHVGHVCKGECCTGAGCCTTVAQATSAAAQCAHCMWL